MRLTIECPAKVNLFLAVGPRDVRGYHPLRTIFQTVGLFDTLIVDTGVSEGSLTCDWSAMPLENTLTRTLRLTREVVDLPPLAIHLEKRIPAQSGLGGGSSDSAGLLKALAQIANGNLKRYEMQSIAAAVGADVPFFLVGGRAIGEGYGDKITPLPDAPTQWLVITRPNVDCSTPEMYARLDNLNHLWSGFPTEDEMLNDFERVAPRESMRIRDQLLSLGAASALLCGSGSAVFGVFGTESAAKAVASAMWQQDHQIFIARTLGREESF